MIPCLDETSLNSVTIIHAYPLNRTLVMFLNVLLLRPCFPVLLNVDMVIGLEGMDRLIGELDTMGKLAITLK